MVFYSGKLIVEPRMENPTLVILTDRNDLDEQLHETFCNCQQVLRREPQQAEDRNHLRKLLTVASGGIVFTTIQKFILHSIHLHLPMSIRSIGRISILPRDSEG